MSVGDPEEVVRLLQGLGLQTGPEGGVDVVRRKAKRSMGIVALVACIGMTSWVHRSNVCSHTH